MNEIIDVINFLAKEGVCKDMQREIMSYFNKLEYIDVLTINGFRDCEKELMDKEYIVHIPNRDDYRPIIRHVFKMIENNYYIECDSLINKDEITIDNKSYSVEKLANTLKKWNFLNSHHLPFGELIISRYDDIQVEFKRKKLKYL